MDTLAAKLQIALDKMIPYEQRYSTSVDSKLKLLRNRYNDFAASLKLFREFLTTYCSSQSKDSQVFDIDEKRMDEFCHYVDIQRAHWSQLSRSNIYSRVRSLVNELPEDLRNRRLLNSKEIQQASRIWNLDPISRAPFVQFLKDGRFVKNTPEGLVLTGRLLSDCSRKKVADTALRFLETIEKNSFTALTQADADNFIQIYTAREQRQVAINYLVDMKPFFSNLQARKLISCSPFAENYNKVNEIDDDFVPPTGLEFFQDLSKVDFKDFCEVRDRLLAVSLCYDFALRIGEVARLKVSDITMNDYVELTIRPEIQKGQNKPRRITYNYFPESKKLMTAYLKLRLQKQPTTDALIVTEKGKRMLVEGCRNAIENLGAKLRVKTFKGDTPAPHRFRHSFGTCNISPLGLKLDVYEIMQRLRHTSVEITSHTYITDNPLLARSKHDAHVKEAGIMRRLENSQPHRSHAVISSNTPTSGVRSVVVENAFEGRGTVSGNGHHFTVLENDAIKALASFEITRQALRKYAEGQGVVEGFFYSSQFIQDLCNNYMTKNQAMETVGLRKSAFHYWISSKGIVTVVIGKASLLRKDDVLARNRDEHLKR